MRIGETWERDGEMANPESEQHFPGNAFIRNDYIQPRSL